MNGFGAGAGGFAGTGTGLGAGFGATTGFGAGFGATTGGFTGRLPLMSKLVVFCIGIGPGRSTFGAGAGLARGIGTTVGLGETTGGITMGCGMGGVLPWGALENLSEMSDDI